MTLKQAVALVFRRRGGALSATDFRHTASFDLKWFPPKDATRLLEAALASGLVKQEGDRLAPTFDVHAVEAPLDFRPDVDALRPEPPAPAPPPGAAPAPAAPPVPAPLSERLAEAAGVATDTFQTLAAAERERTHGLLAEETTLLLAARRRGVDVRPFLGHPK